MESNFNKVGAINFRSTTLIIKSVNGISHYQPLVLVFYILLLTEMH